jgi:hypothetical protein
MEISKAQNHVNKALDLMKGGEGSRGGKIIGHTTSGKPIYYKANHPSHKNFTIEDHEDARAEHGMKTNALIYEENNSIGKVKDAITKKIDKHYDEMIAHTKEIKRLKGTQK